MEFKDRLKQLRLDFGYSGEELGKLIGVSKAAIGNYESGLRKPRHEQMEALADVFNVDLDYLLCRTDTKLRTSYEENRMKYLLNQLNVNGKREAIKRVEELTYVPNYISKEMQLNITTDNISPIQTDISLNAASVDDTATNEDRRISDNIMYDDDEWKC